MELKSLWDKTLVINTKKRIKKRIDNKVIILEDYKEPWVLNTKVSKVLTCFDGGNKLKNLFPSEILNKKSVNNLLDDIRLLIEKGYLVEGDKLSKINITSNWSLDEVFFEITKVCNLKCNHCYIPSNIKDMEMGLEQWMCIVDQCYDLGVYLIKLTGGEAMLSPKFFSIVEYIYNKGIKTRLYTNGSLLTENNLKLLKKFGVNELQISLDGAKAKTHDSFRNTKGNFNKIINILPILQQMKFKVILSFTVSSFNVDEIDEFIKIAKLFNNISVVVSPYINYHQTYKNIDMLKVDEDIISKVKLCYEKNKNIWSDKIKYYTTFSNKYIGYCGFGLYSCYIDSFGKVLLCPLINQEENILGDINLNSLEDIWKNSSLLKKYREYTLSDIDECNTCKNASQCRGGCRARAYYLNHDFLSKDSISCKMFN